MKAIKFVSGAALADHLSVGWELLYKQRVNARGKPAWVFWVGDGTPRHPEAEKLVGGTSGLLSKPARHPNEGID